MDVGEGWLRRGEEAGVHWRDKKDKIDKKDGGRGMPLGNRGNR